jgi:hypothetical protein
MVIAATIQAVSGVSGVAASGVEFATTIALAPAPTRVVLTMLLIMVGFPALGYVGYLAYIRRKV